MFFNKTSEDYFNTYSWSLILRGGWNKENFNLVLTSLKSYERKHPTRFQYTIDKDN